MFGAAELQQKDSINNKVNQKTKCLVGCNLQSRTIRTTPEFNPGLITSFDQALVGKIAGVQITKNSGSIMSGSFIQMRGISSLINSNQPLIVVDGTPLESIYTSSNLSEILNPDDIETITILKDAAANGMYGMRASQGVISITTKKGRSDKLRINFASTNAIQQVTKTADILSANAFRKLINNEGSTSEKALLGNESTNWTNEIFHTAPATNNHIGISGGFAENIPYRVSIGYLNQEGILKTEQSDKLNGSLVINPSFFKNHLNITLNLRGSIVNNHIANTNAIGNAAAMNPTNPVKSDESVYSENFGGYWQSYLLSGNTIVPNSLAVINPVALLYQSNGKINSTNYLANIGIDYNLHFFEDLHIYINQTKYYSNATENNSIPASSPQYYIHGFAQNNLKSMIIKNIQSGLKYNKSFNKHNINASINYESTAYQSIYQSTSTGIDGYNLNFQSTKSTFYFASFFEQIKYNYAERYFLNFNSRLDGSSRLSSSNAWVNARSVGLAWNVTDEDFLKEQPIKLKTRISYGLSGQQPGSNNSTVYNQNLKWEATKTLNYGIDFQLQNNRITGSIDFFNRKTEDLLNYVILPTGTNMNQTILVNNGTINCNGGELTINTIPVMTNKIVWSVSLNAAYQKTVMSDYSANGNIISNYPNPLNLIFKDGYSPAMFYFLKQKYNETGQPIEGSYSDLNADGLINYNDYYAYHSAAPDCILGLNSLITYDKWSVGVSFRSNLGNYVYNATNAILGFNQQPVSLGYLRNITTDYLNTGFKTPQTQSDYYVENASFLKMDYLNIGYDFGKIGKDIKLKLTATVQNVFTITGYTGVDPEIPGGVDYGFYPRPRIFSIGLNLEI
jgi:iron complex outermembrane receptor protein